MWLNPATSLYLSLVNFYCDDDVMHNMILCLTMWLSHNASFFATSQITLLLFILQVDFISQLQLYLNIWQSDILLCILSLNDEFISCDLWFLSQSVTLHNMQYKYITTLTLWRNAFYIAAPTLFIITATFYLTLFLYYTRCLYLL